MKPAWPVYPIYVVVLRMSIDDVIIGAFTNRSDAVKLARDTSDAEPDDVWKAHKQAFREFRTDAPSWATLVSCNVYKVHGASVKRVKKCPFPDFR